MRVDVAHDYGVIVLHPMFNAVTIVDSVYPEVTATAISPTAGEIPLSILNGFCDNE